MGAASTSSGRTNLASPSSLPTEVQPRKTLILRSDREGVRTLTLNRPKARNALSALLMEELQGELDRVKDDAAVKVVVLAGSGPAFCAGHDLKEMRSDPMRGESDEERRTNYENLFAQCSRLMLSITRLPKPVIASVHGVATAAGCQLVATCDLAVASSDARFATPGVNIGLFCSTPMVALTRAVPRKAAMEMLLTGRMIDAQEALRIGLVNRVVEPDALGSAVDELASAIAGKSPYTLAVGKEAFYRQSELALDQAYAYAGKVMTENMMARDAEEGIDAFLEKRSPTWQGR